MLAEPPVQPCHRPREQLQLRLHEPRPGPTPVDAREEQIGVVGEVAGDRGRVGLAPDVDAIGEAYEHQRHSSRHRDDDDPPLGMAAFEALLAALPIA